MVLSVAICLWVAALWVVIHALPQDAAGRQAAGNPPATIDYQQQVHTLLAAKCLSCHSAERRSGGLSLAAYADVLDGGRSGAAIKPGDSAGSLLMMRITGEVAPPMPLGRPALSAGEMATIRGWIDEGARETVTSAAAKPKWEAPLALARPAMPDVVWPNWTSPVDRFVSRYLSDRGDARTGTDWRRRIRKAGLPRYLGAASPARRSSGVSRRQEPEQANLLSSNGFLPTATSTRNTGSRSGTTCCEMMKAPITTQRRHHARASAPGCCRR